MLFGMFLDVEELVLVSQEYPSRFPLQNVGVNITGVRLPILEQQCDQFFSVRLRKPV